MNTYMNKRKRHFIKRETLKKETLKKAKKDKLIGFIVVILMGIVGCIASFFYGKALSYNIFFIFLPPMLIVTTFGVLITWGMLKKKN